MTVHRDLDEAIRRIDEVFGAGYAKVHPELVAALVQAAAFDRLARIEERAPISGWVRKALLTELTELREAMDELPYEKLSNAPSA